MAAIVSEILPESPPVSLAESQGELLHRRTQKIPGSVHYSFLRYRLPSDLDPDDRGWMVYSGDDTGSKKKYLDLVYCVSSRQYCPHPGPGCEACPKFEGKERAFGDHMVDLATFRFTPEHLSQFIGKVKTTSFSEEVVRFRHEASFSRELPLCGRTRKALEELGSYTLDGDLENIFINAQAQILLLYSMECLGGEGQTGICSKFLESEEMRDRITQARNLLLEHLTEPLTIRELSRRVAINECYLKKGFRELFGTTIFDFFQSQRMEHARFLLYQKAMGVTEVSQVLGYSSISHFSTAFKKHTGLKPCELLLR
ncbi:MAG: helix-turn-helix transcriptional regulator [Bacteroidota bacterium]|nr:helix-turn-helix transcriptional regulator [Bacteroidota bacterium]